jgi:hypothetical protein
MRGARLAVFGLAAAASAVAISSAALSNPAAAPAGVSPIYAVAIPEGYRSWELIAPALEDAPFDELRVVLGNPVAVDAFKRGVRPFPDGSILVKLAWKRTPSAEFTSATVPGDATTVQIMVKDSKRFAATGGWGFGRFIGGQSVDEAQHRTCFACHDAKVRDRDWVFTRYAS